MPKKGSQLKYCKGGHERSEANRYKSGGCIPCHKLRLASNKEETKIYYQNYQLKRDYGISLSDYNELLESQGNSCLICTRPQTMFKSRLSVDHDHKTGKIRAILCNPCNVLIGFARENTVVLDRAISYLKEHSIG